MSPNTRYLFIYLKNVDPPQLFLSSGTLHGEEELFAFVSFVLPLPARFTVELDFFLIAPNAPEHLLSYAAFWTINTFNPFASAMLRESFLCTLMIRDGITDPWVLHPFETGEESFYPFIPFVLLAPFFDSIQNTGSAELWMNFRWREDNFDGPTVKVPIGFSVKSIGHSQGVKKSPQPSIRADGFLDRTIPFRYVHERLPSISENVSVFNKSSNPIQYHLDCAAILGFILVVSLYYYEGEAGIKWKKNLVWGVLLLLNVMLRSNLHPL